MAEDKELTRREFVKLGGAAAGGLLLATPLTSMAADATAQNIPSRGYAAVDASGKLVPWSFERRPLGDNDVLIDIKFASICHSDIHQMKGHWGPQKYPQVPGHEIVGVVAAVGKNVTYYAPWGNLAIFYRDFGYAAGLVRLGRIDSGLEALSARGPLQVRIEAEN